MNIQAKSAKPMFGIKPATVKGAGGLSVESPVHAPHCSFTGNCSVGAFSYIGAGSTAYVAKIGRYCSIGPKVTIGMPAYDLGALSTHPFASGYNGSFGQSEEFQRIKGKASPKKTKGVVIGHDVWIGNSVMIMGGVTIGNGAAIGAGAVVVKDVAPYEIVGGVPAKHIRYRFDHATIVRLNALKWWDFDLSPLGSLDYSNIEKSIAAIEEAISEQRLPPLVPSRKKFLPLPASK